MVETPNNPMTGSILKFLRQLLVSDSEDKSFDTDLIVFGNGALSVMRQLGITPPDGFRITGENETWAEFIGDRDDLDVVQEDVYLRVRLIFDPPTNSFLVTALKEQIQEHDWRIEAWHKPMPEVTPEPEE